MQLESNEERWNRWRTRWMQDALIKQLIESGTLDKVVGMLQGRRRVVPFEAPEELEPLDVFVVSGVRYALHKPDVAETMTQGERKRLAAKIIGHCQGLKEALEPFQDGEKGMRYPFQPLLDGLALEIAIGDKDRLSEAEVHVDDDTLNRCRFTVYHLLMDRIDRLFDTLSEGAEWLSEMETIIKKPNDKNAARLRFIRFLNRKFCLEFRYPCRSAVLELASVYFDCSDLDEAAISKLAPFYKPEPVPMSQEQIDFLKWYHGQKGDHTYLERMIAHYEAESKWGMGRESSAE